MKSINAYINEKEIETLNEGLLSKLTGWFKDLYKSQEQLKDNTIKADIKNIKGPEKPTKLKDIENNKEELKLINDKQVGFPITSMLIAQKQKYLTIEDAKGNKKEFEPIIDRYFYVDGKNKYDIGIVMYDDKMKNDNNYVNIINLEVIAQIDNQSEVEKYINEIFEENQKKKFKGSQYVSLHPRVKATLIKQGYKSQNTNKNILFKNFK